MTTALGDDSGTGHGGHARQFVVASGRAQQAAQISGVQYNNFFAERELEGAVSLAPPVGLLDPGLPVRGRDELLAELAQARGVVVACGLAGSGKTALALEVAARAQERGADVWWVSASDPNVLVAGMRAVGRRLGLADVTLDRDDAADLIWEQLSSRSGAWLLVIDNANEVQALAGAGASVGEGRGWVRPVRVRSGLVLVTSRDGRQTSWGAWCQLRRLTMLNPEDAGHVLADYVGGWPEVGSDTDARSLAERLGGLPLALRLVGLYLAEAAQVPGVFVDSHVIRTYRQYQSALDAGDASLGPPGDSPLSEKQLRQVVGRAWQLTLGLVDAQQLPHARALLQLLASFAEAPIPYQLLFRLDILASHPSFVGVTGIQLWRSLQVLDALGLADLVSGVGQSRAREPSPIPVIRVHPLVRDATRAPLDSPGHFDDLELATRLAAAAVGDLPPPEDPAGWSAWQMLAPHSAFLLSDAFRLGCPEEAAANAASAAYPTARYLASQGLHAQAEATYRSILATRLRVLSPDHPYILNTRHQIAYEVAERGDHAGAEALFRDVLVAELRVFHHDHPSILATRYWLARMTGEQGDHVEAEAQLKDVLADRLRLLRPDHPSILATRHQIAYETAKRGDHAGAEAQYREVLADRLRVLGGDHPSTLATRYEIARMTSERGNHDEAEAQYRDVLERYLRVLGIDHPATLAARHEIARMTAKRGDHKEAETQFRDVLADRLRVLGPDHPSTLATRHQITRITAGRGDRTSEHATEEP